MFFPIAIGKSQSNNGDYLCLSNADQPTVGYLGYATKLLITQCWIQLDINSLFSSRRSFFGMNTLIFETYTNTNGCWYCWFRHSISNKKVWPLHKHSHAPAEWRAPLDVTVLIQIWVKSASTAEESCSPDVFVNDGTGSSWHGFAARMMVFQLRPPRLEDRELLEANVDIAMKFPAVGNLAPSPVPHSNFPALAHANGTNPNISRHCPC